MEILILGFATAFNFLIILYKLNKSRYEDVVLDILAIYLLLTMFGGTLGGSIIATISSSIISLVLLLSPSILDSIKRDLGFKKKEIKEELSL